ncbi:hypothetical protein MKZ38_007696 [Zalerion maritima]|uniref:Uncharacterized protein n=1 Tax=Zalerion maritima TaxID=339359 RepID=A0AAD5WP35_9PEZI|nr:hypothetical protein MKZ38_007696 [Zalerion maritima]
MLSDISAPPPPIQNLEKLQSWKISCADRAFFTWAIFSTLPTASTETQSFERTVFSKRRVLSALDILMIDGPGAWNVSTVPEASKYRVPGFSSIAQSVFGDFGDAAVSIQKGKVEVPFAVGEGVAMVY